jgi:hypothetical protein
MPDKTLQNFRRLVRETQAKLAGETVPTEREVLQRILTSRRMDLERYQREPKLTGRARSKHAG